MTIALRLGTRASALAQWQANWVASRLATLGVPVELVHITTQGDVRTGPLATLDGTGLFTKQLQQALLDETIDLAVHSLKDLPTEQPADLLLAAVPEREACFDALVSNFCCTLDQLPAGSRVGTGSSRRRSQLLHYRHDLQIDEIRGNVDTRLRKLDEGQYQAIVLAQAGLIRLGLGWRAAQALQPPLMLPAVGQGALGIECRAADLRTRNVLAHLDDIGTRAAVTAERAMLAQLRGGCLAPVGAWGRYRGGRLLLEAVVLSGDGRTRIASQVEGLAGQAVGVGQQAAAELLQQGAAELIAAARG
jgi:hydroxymethylbilane synthase